MMHKLILVAFAAAMITSAAHAGAQTEDAYNGQTYTAYGTCLLSKAYHGVGRQYSSTDDDGHGATQLMTACPDEYHAWIDLCEKGGEVRFNCTKKAIIMARVVLEMRDAGLPEGNRGAVK